MNLPNGRSFSLLLLSALRWAAIPMMVLVGFGIGSVLHAIAQYLATEVHTVLSVDAGSTNELAVRDSATLPASSEDALGHNTPSALHPPTLSLAMAPGRAAGTGGFAGGGTYSPPPGVHWLYVEMLGGGGGGGAAGRTADHIPSLGKPGAGGDTTFGAGGDDLKANGGSPGCNAVAAVGSSSAACGVGGAGAVITDSAKYMQAVALSGGGGQYPSNRALSTTQQGGGAGGLSAFQWPLALVSGQRSVGGGWGAGGGGGPAADCSVATYAGSGGGAGGYVHVVVIPAAGESFSYSVGAGGAPGQTPPVSGCGSLSGQPGSPGAIIVTEHY